MSSLGCKALSIVINFSCSFIHFLGLLLYAILCCHDTKCEVCNTIAPSRTLLHFFKYKTTYLLQIRRYFFQTQHFSNSKRNTKREEDIVRVYERTPAWQTHQRDIPDLELIHLFVKMQLTAKAVRLNSKLSFLI